VVDPNETEEFESIKFDFMACLFGVYRDKTFVEPGGVNEASKSTIGEVFFAIRHYCLRNKMFDIFQANMQQIGIVKPGASIAASGFKHDAREGLLDVIISRSTTGKDKEGGMAEKRVRCDGGK
jgi:hypothetical protein